MFSKEFNTEIMDRFNAKVKGLKLDALEREMNKREKSEDRDVLEALYCLYAFMPLSDMGDYETETFLDFARHGAFLFNEGEFKGRADERMFAEYVLGARINNEDIAENRRFFYDEVKDLIKGKSMKDAVIELNYWCSSKVTYRTTDNRTANPLTVYNNTYGRCGEESTFAVSVFRSVGIPARQVYVPLWSHCDDNHAWVEVWCDGKWYFLGACEPEDELNQGWFLNASKRAMMVHARCYNPTLEKDVNAGTGIPVAVNALSTYARTEEIAVKVVDEEGKPLSGVRVHFKVINYSLLGDIAVTCTDEAGITKLKTGSGSLVISASSNGLYGEILVDTTDLGLVELQLVKSGYKKDLGHFVMKAPELKAGNGEVAATVKAVNSDERKKAEAKKRADKEAGLFDKEAGIKALEGYKEEDKKAVLDILSLSCGNQSELHKFLTEVNEIPAEWKVNLLKSLVTKDYQDTDAYTLFEHCLYTDISVYERYPKDIFYKYVLCPRVAYEKIIPFRKYLSEKFRGTRLSNIDEVRQLFDKVDTELKEKPELEYNSLTATAYGAYWLGYAGARSKRIIFIQILRSLGLPARLNPNNEAMEVYLEGEFTAIELSKESPKGQIEFSFDEGVNWSYYENFSLSCFVDGGYQTLGLSMDDIKNSGNKVELNVGTYRLITSNRLPNGNIFAKTLIVEVLEEKSVKVPVSFYEAKIKDMLSDYPIRDIEFRKADKTKSGLKELAKGENGIFIWLNAKAEPTEHILNELFEKNELFNKLKTKIYFVVKSEKELEDANIKRVSEALSNKEILFEAFDTEAGKLARELYLEPGLYPLICVANKEGKGVYGTAGYNVGTAEMLLKICKFLEEE
ncbi:MAG: transglutaminase domain-containing protein [Catonella sp.]|uniref:transglutaminase domain-containing protein n=1 Tax=Catonella sp. TaxID=2382125 RepID=UPI003F9F86CF